MKNPERKVSVIVPIYNTAKYLKNCLESLVHQTLEEIEIILINDGSTDGSTEIIKDYKQKYSEKIIVIEQENQGQASARNRGMEQSHGAYIGFVDSDDVVELHMFQKMYERAIQLNADLVECNYGYYEVKNGIDHKLENYAKVTEKHSKQEMFFDPMVAPWNKLYKRKIIQEAKVIFPEKLIYEDTAFYINLIPYVNRFTYMKQEYVKHYFRKNSTQTRKQNPKVGDMLIVIEQILDFYKKRGLYNLYFKELEYFCIKIMLCSSLGRIGMLTDKALKQKYLTEMIRIIDLNFPNFKKNSYFSKGIKSFYIKSFNRITMQFYVPIIALFYKKKMKL